MTDTPRLALPAIEAAQAQKHVTHNEALVLLDALTHLAAETPRAERAAGLTKRRQFLYSRVGRKRRLERLGCANRSV